MSSNKQNYNQSNNQGQSSNDQKDASNSKEVSDYSITKPYGGMKGFMESYGLKIWNDDDVQEAKQIINEMKKHP